MNAAANKCLDCHGTGTRSWPQSRNTNPRNPLEREQLAPQITKCGACAGVGTVRMNAAEIPRNYYRRILRLNRAAKDPQISKDRKRAVILIRTQLQFEYVKAPYRGRNA